MGTKGDQDWTPGQETRTEDKDRRPGQDNDLAVNTGIPGLETRTGNWDRKMT